ncbi:hypothetical protein SLA2020_239330 [Shorea laevis]
MSSAHWPRYPPCASGTCEDTACCGLGKYKFRWPELVGKNAEAAKATIQKDNPDVTVMILTPGRVGSPDFCCNRVYIVSNPQGNVLQVPSVG